MIYGFVIAAGKQSRFSSKTPKALSIVGDSTLLDINFEALSTVCDKVFVVCSHSNSNYFDDRYNKIVIDSGLGCGDAVMKALKQAMSFSDDDTCFIQWGDSIVSSNLYREMLDKYSGMWIIPCELSDYPYVQIFQDGVDRVGAVFSKYGETVTRGMHDLSVFYGPINDFLKSAEQFVTKYFTGTDYSHPHGREFQFLDIFNDTHLNAVAYCTEYRGYSFNTLTELAEIIKEIEVAR